MEGIEIPEVRTRSGRLVRPVQRLIEVMKAEICAHTSEIPGEIFCLQAMFPEEPEPLNPNPLLDYIKCYKAHADPDTMYLHEAMKEPDREDFRNAMIKEV